MIKKILLALFVALGVTSVASARDTYAHDASVLPSAAQSILANYFKANVSVVKIDKDFGRISDYEVVLTDGTEIIFDKNGNWENIEIGKAGKIPEVLIPSTIASYVKKDQPGQKILGIDRDRNSFEVELSNGVEMKFDKEGKFIKYES